MPLIPLAPPPAVAAPAAAAPVYKLSLYGVQRTRRGSTKSAAGTCFDERGSYAFGRDVRFKSARSIRVRVLRAKRVAFLVPVGKDELRLTGTVSTAEHDQTEASNCAALNPDGSTRWVKRGDGKRLNCPAATLTNMPASVSHDGRRLRFSTHGGVIDGDGPVVCREQITLPLLEQRIGLDALLARGGRAVVLRRFESDRDSGGGLVTSYFDERTTVYVELRPPGVTRPAS